MPRHPLLLLAALLVGILVTAAPAAARTPDGRLKVVTSFTILADMARNVAGDRAVVESITKPGAEIHNYQPTPRDLVRAQGADVVLWNGLNLEQWFERFLREIEGARAVTVSDGVEPIAIAEGAYAGKANPHAWMSARDAKVYVANIARALAEADPDNAATYRANADRYAQAIDATAAPARALVASIAPERRWLATSEGAFSYLARDLGLRELAIWPINADQQGTPGQVRRVIDTIRAEGVPAIFSESTVSDRPARQIARETGITYGGVLYVDSLSEADGPVPTFLDMLRVTLETVSAGLREGAVR